MPLAKRRPCSLCAGRLSVGALHVVSVPASCCSVPTLLLKCMRYCCSYSLT